MSSFTCPKCGADILDSPQGYTTGCTHVLLELVGQVDDLAGELKEAADRIRDLTVFEENRTVKWDQFEGTATS